MKFVPTISLQDTPHQLARTYHGVKKCATIRQHSLRDVATALLLALSISACATHADSHQAKAYQQTVHTHPSQGPVRTIEGTNTYLVTTEEAAFAHMETQELEPNHVYTLWWVVINNPEACAQLPCTAEDVLQRTAAVKADVTYADGVVAGPDGSAVLNGALRKGELADSWFGNGFANPQDAEIHLVVNAHGPLLPALAYSMLSSYRGGCRSDSLPEAFPDTAKADGIPGPNTCAMVQDAIFQQ